MSPLTHKSVADSFSNLVEDEERDFTLRDGSRIAVIGGGPAGSFFSYFLLKMAQAIDLDIGVDIFEPRSFKYCGPAGCNHCGGIVSESLVQTLAAEGIVLPRSVVQRGVESYVVHMDVGDVAIESPVHERRIAALYRGNGPREGGDVELDSFDDYLQGMAKGLGANIVPHLITGVESRDGMPFLRYGDGKGGRYDLVADGGRRQQQYHQHAGEPVRRLSTAAKRPAAISVNSAPPGRKSCGFWAGRCTCSCWIFPVSSLRPSFPRGRLPPLSWSGDDLDQELVHAFLNDPVVRRTFPTNATPCVCSCSPLINLGARKRPYGDRVVMVGDSGITRLYKDGIGAAFRTGKAAATSAIFHGVSAKDFEKHYWPTCRNIVNDNRVGKVMFATNAIMKNSRITRKAMLRMAQKEQEKSRRAPTHEFPVVEHVHRQRAVRGNVSRHLAPGLYL